MEDENIKKQLRMAFDDFEEMPNATLFTNINAKLNEAYSVEKKHNKSRKIGISIALIVLLSIGFGYYILKKNTNFNAKENTLKIESYTKNTKIEISNFKQVPIEIKLNNTKSLKGIAEQNQIILDNRHAENNDKNKFLIENSTYFSNKNEDPFNKKTSKSIWKVLHSQNTFNKTNKFLVKDFNQKTKFLVHNNNNLIDKAIFTSENEKAIASNLSSEMVFENQTSIPKNIEETELKSMALIDSKTWKKLNNGLIDRMLPTLLKLKMPKDLPKINKTTPLAFEFSVNPFLGFQKIEATESGLANIQNITEQNIGIQQRVGYALNAALVLNWTKQSRLRLGLSYQNMFQKVGYELATDLYEFKQISNGQTVLIRKGTPYTEQKRHQMIGIKAERQYFLQFSTPTRFYGSLGLEYNKSLTNNTQLLFINSSFGFDFAVAPKVRLQLAPSYSYAIMGTTDTKQFVNIISNHIGVRVGLLYEIRK